MSSTTTDAWDVNAAQREGFPYAVVVPTLAKRDSLHACLDSIGRQTRPPAEVILATPPDTVVENDYGATIVRAPVASTSAQRNAGVDAAISPIILFVDDDIELEPDCAAELMAVWERRGPENISGVAGTCVNEDAFPVGSVPRRILLAAGGLDHKAVLARRSRLMLSGAVTSVRRPVGEVEVDFAVSYCVSYRRELLSREPFDESFTGYVLKEDADLAARMIKHAPLIHTPRARCWHADVAPGLGVGVDAAYRRGRMAAFFRGRHRARGPIGRVAWESSNVAEYAILVARGLRPRDFEPSQAYLRGLRETRAHLRAEAEAGRASR
jgi:glycosyltransferase involved in cell wall biosynthesis